MGPVPASLLVAELGPFWSAVRARLERLDGPTRGRVAAGDLAPPARLALEALLGRQLRHSVDLADLEASLLRLGVGLTLAESLHRLGHPPSPEPARRRRARRAAAAASDAAKAAAAGWAEPWADEWISAVIRSGALRGLSEVEAVAFVAQVRRVLDRLASPGPDSSGSSGPSGSPGSTAPLSRTEIAAELLGDAHGLDGGTRLEVAVTRALALRHELADRRELWAAAGAQLDLTSAPALVWNLPLTPSSGLGRLVSEATTLGVPVHLSQLALRRHPLQPQPGAEVLVVENPRVVEAAAQRRSHAAVACSAGNPSGAVQLLVAQLLAGGAVVRYHGDFDSPGLAICGRMQAAGAKPWRMDAADYERALAAADLAGVALPHDDRVVPPTPWSPPLQGLFEQHRRVVHEERLLDVLLR